MEKRCTYPNCENDQDAEVRVGLRQGNGSILWFVVCPCVDHLGAVVDLKCFNDLTMGAFSSNTWEHQVAVTRASIEIAGERGSLVDLSYKSTDDVCHLTAHCHSGAYVLVTLKRGAAAELRDALNAFLKE